MVSSFDVFVIRYDQALIHNPRQLDMWMLAIDRQRQAGNLQAALRLCQKAHRFHQGQESLKKTIENLSMIAVLGSFTHNGDGSRVIDACQDEAGVDES